MVFQPSCIPASKFGSAWNFLESSFLGQWTMFSQNTYYCYFFLTENFSCEYNVCTMIALTSCWLVHLGDATYLVRLVQPHTARPLLCGWLAYLNIHDANRGSRRHTCTSTYQMMDLLSEMLRFWFISLCRLCLEGMAPNMHHALFLILFFRREDQKWYYSTNNLKICTLVHETIQPYQCFCNPGPWHTSWQQWLVNFRLYLEQ